MMTTLKTGTTETVNAAMTLKDAARLMRRFDLDALEVRDHGIPLGLVTDFDIIVRSTAEDLHPTTTTLRDYLVHREAADYE
jgi:CBS domain-containing protein